MFKHAPAVAGILLLALLAGCGTRAAAGTASAASRSAAEPVTAYVATSQPDIVVPIRLGTGRFLKPIRVRSQVIDMAVTPDGRIDVAVSFLGSHRCILTLIHTATGKAFKSLRFNGFPWSAPMVFSPDGHTGYIADDRWRGAIVPVQTRTGRLGAPIRVGHDPETMAITPDGATLYVANSGSGTVTPIRTATGAALPPIKVGKHPGAIAITPDGKTAYVSSDTTDTVAAIQTAANTVLKRIQVGPPGPQPDPNAIAITPDGKTAYVLGAGRVTPVAIATNQPGKPIPVGADATSLAMAPDGRTLYAVGFMGDLTLIRTSTGTALRNIRLGNYFLGDVAFTPDSRLLYVAVRGRRSLIPIRATTGERGKALKLPGTISSFAVAP